VGRSVDAGPQPATESGADQRANVGRQSPDGGGRYLYGLRQHRHGVMDLGRVLVPGLDLQVEVHIAPRQATESYRQLLGLGGLIVGDLLSPPSGRCQRRLVGDELEGTHDAAVPVPQRRRRAGDIHRLAAHTGRIGA